MHNVKSTQRVLPMLLHSVDGIDGIKIGRAAIETRKNALGHQVKMLRYNVLLDSPGVPCVSFTALRQ